MSGMKRHTDKPSFADLRNYIDGLPDQVMGHASAICEVGEPYVEFRASALSRPEDIGIVEREVTNEMWKNLDAYFSTRAGRIYWRIPLETDIADTAVVIEYKEDGPDIDFLTDRKCVLDRSWKRVGCYCRLYRATHALPVKTPAQIRAELRVPISADAIQRGNVSVPPQ